MGNAHSLQAEGGRGGHSDPQEVTKNSRKGAYGDTLLEITCVLLCVQTLRDGLKQTYLML